MEWQEKSPSQCSGQPIAVFTFQWEFIQSASSTLIPEGRKIIHPKLSPPPGTICGDIATLDLSNYYVIEQW